MIGRALAGAFVATTGYNFYVWAVGGGDLTAFTSAILSSCAAVAVAVFWFREKNIASRIKADAELNKARLEQELAEATQRREIEQAESRARIERAAELARARIENDRVIAAAKLADLREWEAHYNGSSKQQIDTLTASLATARQSLHDARSEAQDMQNRLMEELHILRSLMAQQSAATSRNTEVLEHTSADIAAHLNKPTFPPNPENS